MDPSIVNQALEARGGLSPLELFLTADIVVKAVMGILLLLSIWCWAVIFAKWRTVRRLNREADEFEDAFWSGGSLDELYDRINAGGAGPMAAVFAAAMREWRRAGASGGQRSFGVGLKERLDRTMSVAIGREMGAVESGMTVLASTASAAPFIGLFGTVWGIINSFSAIAAEKTTNLAVVAPGIAEALFRDGARPVRGHPGDHRLQQVRLRPRPLWRAARHLRRRLPGHSRPPDRRGRLTPWPVSAWTTTPDRTGAADAIARRPKST